MSYLTSYFFWIIWIFVGSAITYLVVFTQDKPIFIRDKNYRPDPIIDVGFWQRWVIPYKGKVIVFTPVYLLVILFIIIIWPISLILLCLIILMSEK